MRACVSACLSRELQRMSVQSVDGMSGVGHGHSDNNGMKCSYCLKFAGWYSVCTVEGDTNRGVQRGESGKW